MLLRDFTNRYESLVDLLCWSAQVEVTDRMRSTYSDHKEWFKSHYNEVRSELTIAIKDEPLLGGISGNNPVEDFDVLFLQEDLDTALNTEFMLPKIVRTRHTVDKCWQNIVSE